MTSIGKTSQRIYDPAGLIFYLWVFKMIYPAVYIKKVILAFQDWLELHGKDDALFIHAKRMLRNKTG